MNRFAAVFATIVVALILTGSAVRADSPQGDASTATIEFLFVGLGDATLVRSPEGNVALIDAGPSDDDIVPLLRARGVDVIDVAIVSHRHIDHYGGMDAVLKAFEVKHLIENGSPSGSRSYNRFLGMVAERHIPVSQPSQVPTTINLGTVVLKVLPLPPESLLGSRHQSANDRSSGLRLDHHENDRSIGVRVEYGSFSVLVTGDSGRVERAWWQSSADASLYRDATILRLAHHGSATGTDEAWIDAVNPQAAVVSMGLDVIWKRWTMPAPEVIQLLKTRRIKLHNTALSGTVGIRTNGVSWEVFKDGMPVEPRVDRARILRDGLQYAITGCYLALLLLVGRGYRQTWRRLAAYPFVTISLAPIVLILYGVLGTSFGLPDLFWHDRAAIQFIAGLSLMWLTLLLAVLARNDGTSEGSSSAGYPAADTRVGIPLVLVTLPAAFLPVFSGQVSYSIIDLRERIWLPAGMLIGLGVATAIAHLVTPKVAPGRRWLLASRAAGVATALGVAVTMALVVTGQARPPAAVSVCLLIAVLNCGVYATRRMPLRRYVTLCVVLIWMVFTTGRDPYRLRLRGLDEYYTSGSLVDIAYFRGNKDGLRGTTAKKTAAGPDEVRLQRDKDLLDRWRDARRDGSLRPLVVVSVSGGGIAASVWTAMCLDRLIKTIPGFAEHVRVITGASGGMVAAGYFVASLARPEPGIPGPDDSGLDTGTLTLGDRRTEAPAVRTVRPSVDLVGDLAQDVLTPVASHIALAGLPSLFWPWRVPVDRGLVLEKAWETNTRGVLATPFAALSNGESEGWRPSLIVTPMMVEEGRPLIVSNIDLHYLDEVEHFKMFPVATTFRLSTAIRMNAAFPLVTPAASLPTVPPRRVVDAGYFDNYGVSTAAAWISANQTWLTENTTGVVLIQIRAYPLTSEEKENYVMSALERSVQGATSPLEGYAAAKKRAMIDRNNSLVAQLQESFQQLERNQNFFSTVVLECNEEAALSWSITGSDRRRLAEALDSIENAQAFERVQILLGAKRPTLGRIVE